MKRRWAAMISSTARDLPDHRNQVRLACERAGFDPCEMMENLTAENASPVEVSLRMVGQADVYIGIFGRRYGTIPPGSDVSITEMEYNRAVALDKPRLIFLAHENHQFPQEAEEAGEAAIKLRLLKARLGGERAAAFFHSPDDLRACIGEALNRLGRQLDAAEAARAAAPEGPDRELLEYIEAVCAALEQPAYELPLPDLPEMSSARPFIRVMCAARSGGKADFAAYVTQAEQNRQVLILSGGAGLGKSTTLRFIASSCWHAPDSAGLSRPHIPVFVNLPTLSSAVGVSFPKRLHDLLTKQKEVLLENNISATKFENWLKDSRTPKLFVFDALDEIPYGERKDVFRFVKFAAEHYKCVTLLGTRPGLSFEACGFETLILDLEPFDGVQRRRLAASFLKKTVDEFLADV